MKSPRACRELAEPKIGRLTFDFATEKLKKLDAEVEAFMGFIVREKFQEKRNADISHKDLTEQWATQGLIHISYRTLRRLLRNLPLRNSAPKSVITRWPVLPGCADSMRSGNQFRQSSASATSELSK
jgi:hypothetical protein